MSKIREVLTRRVPAWAVVLALYASAAVALAQIAPSPVHPSSSGAATSVSAAAFPLLAPDGTGSAPSYSFANDPDQGLFRSGVNALGWAPGSVMSWFAGGGSTAAVIESDTSPRFNLRSNGAWGISPGEASITADTDWTRAAAGVWKAGNGAAGNGWVQNAAGDKFLTANATNATTTFSDLTDLTVNVTSGRKYIFELALMLSNSVAADGYKLDFNGGTATATDFRVSGVLVRENGGTVTGVEVATALATVLHAGVLPATTQHQHVVKGSFEPSSTGTFIPRVAMNAATTGTLTVYRGSNLTVKDMP